MVWAWSVPGAPPFMGGLLDGEGRSGRATSARPSPDPTACTPGVNLTPPARHGNINLSEEEEEEINLLSNGHQQGAGIRGEVDFR